MTAPSTRRRQKKDWSKALPPSSIQPRESRKRSKKFDSQNTRDIIATEAKEQRRKDREAKQNRTGTSRIATVQAVTEVS
jgi:hypothetical protein